MAGGDGDGRKGGGAEGTPPLVPPPMTPGGDGKKPWYHKDNYYPGVPRPAPGTPYGNHGAVIIRTDPCVIYDPGMGKNNDFLKAMTAEDAEKYNGEWIGVADGVVIAHGEDYMQVYEETCKADKGTPLMHHVGPTDEGKAVFLNIW